MNELIDKYYEIGIKINDLYRDTETDNEYRIS